MDEAVQNQIRASAAASGGARRVGPFLIRFDRHSANRFRNYAIPDDDANPSEADVAALVAAFRGRDRTPRLEYLPSLAPSVEPALLAAGFRVENRAVIMGCPTGGVVAAAAPAGVEITEPADDAGYLAVARVQNTAYGEPEPAGEPDVARLRTAAENGGVVALASANGTPAGGGLCTPPAGEAPDTCELAAVAVARPYRRRGIAAALTAFLAATAHARGVRTVWLEPAGAAEQRIYSRVGFTAIGEKLNIALE